VSEKAARADETDARRKEAAKQEAKVAKLEKHKANLL